jgi:hypothetical protein
VTRGSAERGPRPAELLLGDHDRVEAAAAELHREAAELADRVADALEQLRVLGDHEARPVLAAGLLVGEQAEDHIARGRLRRGARAQECGEHHRDASLHVQGASAPDEAVGDLARERLVKPLAPGGDDVDVPLQEKGRSGAAAGQPGDQVRALGAAGKDPHLAAGGLEQAADPVDALDLAAGRVAGVEADQPREQLGGTLVDVGVRGAHLSATTGATRTRARPSPA